MGHFRAADGSKRCAQRRGQVPFACTCNKCAVVEHMSWLEDIGHGIPPVLPGDAGQSKPKMYFNRQGWTGAGARADDMDAQRICATPRAKEFDAAMDQQIRQESRRRTRKSPAAAK